MTSSGAIASLSNAKIATWTPRTAPSAHGRATFGPDQLASKPPVLCVVSPPTSSQSRTAQLDGIEVTSVISLASTISVVILVGDRITVTGYPDIDGKTLEVTRRSGKMKVGMGRVLELFVMEVGA